MDDVVVSSHAHHFRCIWINVASLEVLQSAYHFIPRSPTCLMDDILDPKRHFNVVQHDDRPPLAIINKVGLPWATLRTILKFSHFHAF